VYREPLNGKGGCRTKLRLASMLRRVFYCCTVRICILHLNIDAGPGGGKEFGKMVTRLVEESSSTKRGSLLSSSLLYFQNIH
jgi:hypothetical protein